MSRLIYYLTLLLAFVGAACAQVSTINTPAGPIAIGATITITWVYTPQTNPIQGILSIVDSTTQNTVIISSTITLSTQSFQWTVNVPAGTYYLALNDGSGNKDTGTFTVFAPGGTTSNSTAPAPATSGAAAPAAPAGSGAAAPASAAPTGGASPASPAQQPSAAAPASQQPSTAAKAPPANSGSSSSGNTTSKPATGSPTTAPTSSDAAISFTGSSIKLLFSLIVVAAAMVHFA